MKSKKQISLYTFSDKYINKIIKPRFGLNNNRYKIKLVCKSSENYSLIHIHTTVHTYQRIEIRINGCDSSESTDVTIQQIR